MKERFRLFRRGKHQQGTNGVFYLEDTESGQRTSPPAPAVAVRKSATPFSPAHGSPAGRKAGFTLGSAINSRRSFSAGVMLKRCAHSVEEREQKLKG